MPPDRDVPPDFILVRGEKTTPPVFVGRTGIPRSIRIVIRTIGLKVTGAEVDYGRVQDDTLSDFAPHFALDVQADRQYVLPSER